MLDVKVLRENPELIRANLEKRGDLARIPVRYVGVPGAIFLLYDGAQKARGELPCGPGDISLIS